MPAKQLLAASLETGFNHLLALEPDNLSALASLSGKQCELLVQELGFPILLDFSADAVRVSTPEKSIAGEALSAQQVSITLSIFALKAMQDTSNITALIREGKLDFVGNLQIAQQLSGAIQQMNFDVEEILSRYIGDVAAYSMVNHAKDVASKLAHQHGLFRDALKDALLDEKPVAVRPIIVENFIQEVAVLRDDTARLEARLRILEAKKHKQGKA